MKSTVRVIRSSEDLSTRAPQQCEAPQPQDTQTSRLRGRRGIYAHVIRFALSKNAAVVGEANENRHVAANGGSRRGGCISEREILKMYRRESSCHRRRAAR